MADEKSPQETPQQSIKQGSDSREHVNIVFIGHVDAGKSTLSGQILYSMGQVDERTMEKYKKEAKEKNRESWYISYIMDLAEEERAKGKTIDVSRAKFESEKKRYTILDAPGHKLYVKNMISGAAQADVAILVISAKKGEFETGFEKEGQTREHATLAMTYGITHMIVAINKMDEQSVQWDKERFDQIAKSLSPFLAKLGYGPNKVKYVPCSGQFGANVVNKIETGVCPWYDGSTLIETLDALSPIPRDEKAPLRIPIIDKFKDRGVTSVFGKIESGIIKTGDKITVMPNKQEVEVIGLRYYDDDIGMAKAGDNVQILLKGVDEGDIQVGHVLCDSKDLIPVVKDFLGQFMVLNKPLFAAGYSAVMHVHVTLEVVTISELVAKIDKKTGKKMDGKPKIGQTGDTLIAKFELDKPICMEKYDVNQHLGRFTIRESSGTVMVGKVIGIKKPASASTGKE